MKEKHYSYLTKENTDIRIVQHDSPFQSAYIYYNVREPIILYQ